MKMAGILGARSYVLISIIFTLCHRFNGSRCDNLQLAKRDEENASRGNYPFSYIEEIWDDSYLGIRSPIPVNVNPAYLLNDSDANSFGGDYLKAASTFSISLAKWVHKLRAMDLDIDTPPSCMSPYIKLCGSARIPQKVRDVMPATGSGVWGRFKKSLQPPQYILFVCH